MVATAASPTLQTGRSTVMCTRRTSPTTARSVVVTRATHTRPRYGNTWRSTVKLGRPSRAWKMTFPRAVPHTPPHRPRYRPVIPPTRPRRPIPRHHHRRLTPRCHWRCRRCSRPPRPTTWVSGMCVKALPPCPRRPPMNTLPSAPSPTCLRYIMPWRSTSHAEQHPRLAFGATMTSQWCHNGSRHRQTLTTPTHMQHRATWIGITPEQD